MTWQARAVTAVPCLGRRGGHRDAHVGGGESGRVVDAVAHHRHPLVLHAVVRLRLPPRLLYDAQLIPLTAGPHLGTLLSLNPVSGSYKTLKALIGLVERVVS